MGTFTELERQGHDFNVLLHREEDDDDNLDDDDLETITEAAFEDAGALGLPCRKESIIGGMVIASYACF